MKFPDFSGRSRVIGVITVMLSIMAGPAMAAGGAVPTLVQDISAALLLAGMIAIIFARLKIPSIAAFLLAGIVLGPQGFNFVNDPANIEAISQIGFVLLLFVIGLEIDVRSLLRSGKSILVAGVLQYPLTLLFGFVVTKALILFGLGGILADAPLAPLYLGVAIAGSSSILVIKLFQEHFQLDTQPGRISLTVLIFQDIWAIIVILIQPSLENPDIAAIAFSFLGIGVLLVIAIVLERLVMVHAFRWIAKVPELILLGAMAWCFALVAIGTNLDKATMLIGFNLHMAVGSGMAALIAGATIASLPFSTEIVTKVSLVKDFFITLFFVGLGITMPAITGVEIPLLALFLGVLAIVARQIVFFPLFYAFGIDQRSAEVSSIRLAQLSEFGLVIAFLGLELGHINNEIASIIILAFVFTAILTTPLFQHAYTIYDRCKGILAALGFREPKAAESDGRKDVTLAILGIHRDASSFLSELSKKHSDVLEKTVVVDFNVALHQQIRDMGVSVTYGDISNEETLAHAGVDRAKVVVCTISDDLLRGINNRGLVQIVRHMNPNGIIIANATNVHTCKEIEEAGANIVYMPRLEVARLLTEAFEHATAGDAEEFAAQQMESYGDPSERNEVLS